MTTIDQSGLAELYREVLLQDIVPFWMRHGIDRQYGGISNILDDDGNAEGYDKYLWSQGRALWTFSALFNRDKNDGEGLHKAISIYICFRLYFPRL